MIGVIVNTVAVLIGSTLGLLLKRKVSGRVSRSVLCALGLCTFGIGISGAIETENMLIVILSIAIGAWLGTSLSLGDRFERLTHRIEKKLRGEREDASLAEGFITASLLFCVGAMTVVGSLNAGLRGDNTMLFTKSVMDLISSIVLSATLGIGVLFSAGFVLVFQGALVLLSALLSPILTSAVITEMTAVGSVLIFGLGLNIVGVAKLKILDYLPAIFFPILFCPLFDILEQYINALL